LSAIILQFGANTDRAKNAMAQLASSVASNMGTVASVMGSTALATGTATGVMSTGFGNAALAVARFAVQYRLLLGTLAAVGAGIAIAAGELDELVRVGDKAKAVRLSPETFQAFTKEAERARIATKEAEAALTAFNTANKERFDPSNEKGGRQSSPLDKFLQDLVLIQRELQNSPALDRFLNAGDRDAQLRATISLVRELQQVGQDLAATSLAEKAFGGAGEKIAEEIRQGRFEMESVTREATAAGIIFSNELVNRAVELRNRLADASREIGDNLKPFLEGSAEIALQIGSGLRLATEAAAGLARAANNVRQQFAGALGVVDQLLRFMPALNPGGTIARGVEAIDQLTARRGPVSTGDALADARARLAAGQGQQLGQGAVGAGVRIPIGFDGVELTGRNVITELPRGRPSDIDNSRARGGRGGAADNYDERLETVKAYIEQLEKANRLAQAEVETFGKGVVEREKALALSRLSVTATDAEKQKILELAESTGKYKQQLADLETQQRRNAEAARYFGDAATDALTDLLVEGKKADEVLKNLVKSLASTALRGLLTGQGAFGLGGGGLFGILGGLFGLPGRAGGGSVFGGSAYMVGENGPELFLPGQSGTIVPNGALGGGGGGGSVTVQLALTQDLDARIMSASRGVAVQVVKQGIDANNQKLPAMLAQRDAR
jgi:hypothetical protein